MPLLRQESIAWSFRSSAPRVLARLQVGSRQFPGQVLTLGLPFEFLPGWDQLEEVANGGRGASAEYVRSLRGLAQTARVDIMGRHRLSHQILREEAVAGGAGLRRLE